MFMRESIREITADELRVFMVERDEGSYSLVDVRQPQEYRQEHLPGAKLLPVGELEARITELASAQDHIFYCKSGARSAAAALLAHDNKVLQGRLLILQGGITAWGGGSVAELPRVDVFSGISSARGVLMKALDLEKAAYLMYRRVRDMSKREGMCDLMDTLIGVEEAHARVVYKYLNKYWVDSAESLPEFEPLFESLTGSIMEGGLTMEDLDPWIRGALDGECFELADLALEVELNAYDLYRTLARMAAQGGTGTGLGSDAELIFLDLAVQEKHHARMIMRKMSAFEGVPA